MSRASEETLNRLHEVVAETLGEQIQKYRDGEYLDKEGNPLPIPSALLSTATKYLNDNQVNRAEQDEPDASDLLADELPNFGE